MTEMTATIRNGQGIHCRPSAVIVKTAMEYPGRLEVITDTGTCDLKSIMGLLALCLEQGRKVRIRVHGPDEEGFCGKLVELFETQFDYPPLD